MNLIEKMKEIKLLKKGKKKNNKKKKIKKEVLIFQNQYI